MSSNSRIKNVSRNATVGLICQFIDTIVKFVLRTFFIKALGAEYLGVNGLFTNVLTILSFAELGIGNAIVFSMYKPLATGDSEKLGSLMALYKKAYNIIGVFIAAVGLCVTPFLGLIIRDAPCIKENISLLYILFLTNTVASYFFVYKKNIIIADQKNYIVLALTEGIIIVQTIIQCILLFITHNYILYLVVQIAGTFASNIIASVVANKMYPFLNRNTKQLSKEESTKIFSDVKALALYKFGSVILNGTDNILVSIMVSVRDVGLVSNYTIITSACNGILGKIVDAFTASVGNLNAIGEKEKQYNVFKKVMFITCWLYGYASVGLVVVSSPFIIAWVGKDYLLGFITVIAIAFEFYVKGAHYAAFTYRTTLGLFVEGKWSPILAAIINIVLSIVLCNIIGLPGIFIATPIARILTTGLIDPILIYKRTFHKNPLEYYGMYIGYVILFVILGGFSSYVIALIPLSGWIGFLAKAIAVTIVFNLFMLLIFCRTKMFKEILEGMKSMLRRKYVS